YPGCPHAVFTPENCICAGSHFLLEASICRTLKVQSLLERNPELTNDEAPDDIFVILQEFIERTLEGDYLSDVGALDRFRLQLERYIDKAGSGKINLTGKEELLIHMERRS